MDNPTSHWGKVVYAGDCQVNHNQEERILPVEKLAPPGTGWRALGAQTDLACALILCVHWLCDALRTALRAARHPNGHRLHY